MVYQLDVAGDCHEPILNDWTLSSTQWVLEASRYWEMHTHEVYRTRKRRKG